MPREKKQKCPPCAVEEWMLTYGDMVTLLLTFFVLLYSMMVPDAKDSEIQLILAAFEGLGNLEGGNTLEPGSLADGGFPLVRMPSSSAGNSLAEAKLLATDILSSDAQNEAVKVTTSERGLVISLSGDAFFEKASAEVKIATTRDILYKVAKILIEQGNRGKFFRIEGHSDDLSTDPNGKWKTNWELASARANNILHLLSDFEVDETRMQSVSYGDVRPSQSNLFPDGRAYNRRVDIVIVTEGNLF